MIYLFLLGDFLTAILFGIVIIPNILLISHKKSLFDTPNGRKVHSIPIPRLGGLSFFPVIILSMCLTMGVCYYIGFPIINLPSERVLGEFLFLTVGCMLLYLVGVTDDLIEVSYRYKFITQVLASLLFILSGTWINSLGGLFGIYEISATVGIPFTILVIVYITNAINLIDGIDGLASGLCCIALTILSIMYIASEEYIYALLALATLGVLLPFWFYNVFGNAGRGKKLFMGDAGSLTLGYILSFLVIRLSMVESHGEKVVNPYMVIAFSTLLVPIFDVVRVVLFRLRNGRNPFLPDKNHFHHKLLRTGMRTYMVMPTILFISLLFIGLNILLIPAMNITLLLLLDLFLWILMHLYINRRITLYKRKCNQEKDIIQSITKQV